MYVILKFVYHFMYKGRIRIRIHKGCIRDGLTYRERPDLGTFTEGVFESIFIEIIRGWGCRNDIIGAVYRPPGWG